MSTSNTDIRQRHQQAIEALQSNRANEAHQLCLSILKEDPTFADAWFICAIIAAQNGLVAKSVEILKRSLVLEPENAEYLAEMGKQLLALHFPDQALEHAKKAWDQTPQQIPTLNTLGTVFSQTGEHEWALKSYETAVQLLEERKTSSGLDAQWRAELYFNFAASLQFAGQFETAEAVYEKAIALQPTLFKAHSALSTLKQQTSEKNHLKRLEGLRDAVRSPRDQLHLGHAIAKELEDIADYEASFEALVWAKSRQSEASEYTFQSDKHQFDAIRNLFDSRFFAAQAEGCQSDEPIFIVGMPRTGTTLVEQILASHSHVFAAGELQNFPLQVKRLSQTSSPDVVDLETVIASSKLDTKQLGENYLASTRPRTGHSARFIDKLPLNFIYLGLIKRALPKAKLVCLRRDPMDTCLSNYRQLFAVDFRHYHYNYDLMTCGQYFTEFNELMLHWHTLMPNQIHDVSYEALVSDPETHARRLVEFCGLPWEPQCLDFHKSRSSVATPSAVQVRQGIYQSSVKRWERYGERLDPLYSLLTSAGFYPEG